MTGSGRFDGDAAARYDHRWSGYLERTFDVVHRELDPLGVGERLLDLGCGTGALLRHLLTRGGEGVGDPGSAATPWVGIDPSEDMLQVGRGLASSRRVALLEGRAERLPLADGAFDTVISTSSLHRWTNPEAGLREMARVLRPGGRFLIVDWCADDLLLRWTDRWLRWVKGEERGPPFRLRELRECLTRAGLRTDASGRFRAGVRWGMMWVRGGS